MIYDKLGLKIGENIVQAEVILRDLVLPYIVADGIIIAEGTGFLKGFEVAVGENEVKA